MTATNTCNLCSSEFVYRKADNLTLKSESHSRRGSTCLPIGSTTTVLGDVDVFIRFLENNNSACDYCWLGVMFDTINIFLSSPGCRVYIRIAFFEQGNVSEGMYITL